MPYWMQRRLLWICSSVLLLMIVSFSTLILSRAQETAAPFDLDRIKRATVFIMQTQEIAGKPVVTCVSSGTLVSRDGLIISNAHSTAPSDDCPGDRLVIALYIREDDPPVEIYQADVVQYDAGLDLALLRITREFDGRLINSADLSLPFVDLADSANVSLDDTVTVVGYPGMGDQPVTAVRATVQAFTVEPLAENRAWIKIVSDPSAASPITGTMSGGGAYNRDGQLIGIPTTAPLRRQSAIGTCKAFQDTNDDGLINQNDQCVPIGGSINALRPANFARPLIRSGSLGLSVEKLNTSVDLNPVTGSPSVRRLFFAGSATNNMPTNVIGRLPTGADSLYLFFDYTNMTPETIYELRVTRDGNVDPILSLAPVRWSGGTSGMWHIGTTELPLPNGRYEFTLFVDGQAAASPQSIDIGGPPQPLPTFRNIVFALVEDNQMFGSGYVMGAGEVVTAQFNYDNMSPGTPWTVVWYRNNAELSRVSSEWSQAEPNGSNSTSLRAVDGVLLPGRYRLELYIGDRLADTADFTIAGERSAAIPEVIDRESLRFVVAGSPQDALSANAVTSFTNQVNTLYALFNWQLIAPGTLWQMRWTVDGTVFYDQTVPWTTIESGENFLIRLTGPNGVPDGTYVMDILIDNVPLGRAEVEIGIGQLPLDPFADPDGVLMRGRIMDADTRQGIANATIILISEDYSIVDFVWDQSQVYAIATTDRNGNYQVDRPLRLEAPYSVMVAVEGYLPMAADGFTVDTETPNPLNYNLFLTKD